MNKEEYMPVSTRTCAGCQQEIPENSLECPFCGMKYQKVVNSPIANIGAYVFVGGILLAYIFWISGCVNSLWK